MPLLLRPGQGRFENVLVPYARQASVLAELIVMDGVDNHPAQPLGLGTTPGHRLLRQLSQGVAILLGSLRGDSQGSFGFGIVPASVESHDLFPPPGPGHRLPGAGGRPCPWAAWHSPSRRRGEGSLPWSCLDGSILVLHQLSVPRKSSPTRSRPERVGCLGPRSLPVRRRSDCETSSCPSRCCRHRCFSLIADPVTDRASSFHARARPAP